MTNRSRYPTQELVKKINASTANGAGFTPEGNLGKGTYFGAGVNAAIVIGSNKSIQENGVYTPALYIQDTDVTQSVLTLNTNIDQIAPVKYLANITVEHSTVTVNYENNFTGYEVAWEYGGTGTFTLTTIDPDGFTGNLYSSVTNLTDNYTAVVENDPSAGIVLLVYKSGALDDDISNIMISFELYST